MSGRRRCRAARVAWLAAAAALGACKEPSPLTQIVAVVDSDLAVPSELDRIAIEVEHVQLSEAAEADLREGGLPRSLGLVHAGGPLGPIEVIARGQLGDAQVVERRAVVAFVRDRTLELRLPLTRKCAERHAPCKNETTCDEGQCVPAEQSELPAYDGLIEPFLQDAGVRLEPPSFDAL